MYILLTDGSLIETQRIVQKDNTLKVEIKTDKISILTQTIPYSNVVSITINKPT